MRQILKKVDAYDVVCNRCGKLLGYTEAGVGLLMYCPDECKDEEDNEERENNRVIEICKKIIDYKKRLSKGCTCVDEDEHQRLGCVSLTHYIDVRLQEMNEIFYGEEE